MRSSSYRIAHIIPQEENRCLTPESCHPFCSQHAPFAVLFGGVHLSVRVLACLLFSVREVVRSTVKSRSVRLGKSPVHSLDQGIGLAIKNSYLCSVTHTWEA